MDQKDINKCDQDVEVAEVKAIVDKSLVYWA